MERVQFREERKTHMFRVSDKAQEREAIIEKLELLMRDPMSHTETMGRVLEARPHS